MSQSISPALMETDLRGTVIDLPFLSNNFPPNPKNEVVRDNVINTLTALVTDQVYAVIVEGPEAFGKTTVLSQFVRRHARTAVSIFISSANRLSYDVDLIRRDLATQVHWILTSETLDLASFDSALLKTYYSALQRQAKHKKQLIYYVVDGLEELNENDRNITLQQLSDILPIGVPQFRFLVSGDESHYKGLFGKGLALKPYTLTEFSVDETRRMLAGFDLAPQVASEITSICRGMPGRLNSALRAMEKGTPPEDFVRDAPAKWPEFFEIDWKQVDENNDLLLRCLALLSHDRKPHTLTQVADTLGVAEETVRAQLSAVNFVLIEPETSSVYFVNSGLLQFVAGKLANRKTATQRLLIKRLKKDLTSPEALLALPEYLEEVADYPDLIHLLTPEHILQVLERSQTLSKVDDTVKRGFRGAQKLNREADVLRFGLQQSIIAELATRGGWASEVAALAALGRSAEALTLANNALLREDRLEMLTTLAHALWLRGDVVPADIPEQIRLLAEHVDFGSLGRRAHLIASNLTCVDPDTATYILKRASWSDDNTNLDRAFVSLTVSALRSLKDERRVDQAMQSIARTKKDPVALGMIEGVRVLSGRLSPAEVCSRSRDIQRPETRIGVLRYWCVLNSTAEDADLVASEGLKIALNTPTTRLDSDLQADFALALAGAPQPERKRTLIGFLDGIRSTAERLGPSVDYVRLQLLIASWEVTYDQEAAEIRLTDMYAYIARIGDLVSRGESYARFLATITKLTLQFTLKSGKNLLLQCSSELESVVLTLSSATADHYLALGGIITGLSDGDFERALDYTKVVNTESRRDAIFSDLLQTLLRRPIDTIQVSELIATMNAIRATDDRDDALVLIMDRFSHETSVAQKQIDDLFPVMQQLYRIKDSVAACHAIVCALRLLHRCGTVYQGEQTHFLIALRDRWKQIDVGWIRVDAGFGIARDLAQFNAAEANKILNETEEMKVDCGLVSPRPAMAYLACIRLVVRIFCGLIPKRLETSADLAALAALIETLPAYGERAVLWADLCMRASAVGRQDLAESVARTYLEQAFNKVPTADASYRARILIQIAPALYKMGPTTCLEEIDRLDADDRDVATREVIRFLTTGRVPSDPIEANSPGGSDLSYDLLRQIESLASRLETDWMIYATATDIADALESTRYRYAITLPQREDIGKRFIDLAKSKLPILRQITHNGFRIATMAQGMKISRAKAPEWTNLIREAERMENIADRAYVRQIIALCLPAGMSSQKALLFEAIRREIPAIPWQFDQIERYIGLADDVSTYDSSLAREMLDKAATVLAKASENVEDLRRRLIDIACRVDEAFAKKLIDAFDDDQAKQMASRQMRLLEIRKSIGDNEGKPDEDKVFGQIRSSEVPRLGALLVRALNSGRVQTCHPANIRKYLNLAALHPLAESFSVLMWYVENSVVRFSNTDQAATFIRPMFDACIVSAQLAGRIAGKALIRLRAVKLQPSVLASGHSLLVTPSSRSEAMKILEEWLRTHLLDDVLIHDPYFGPGELPWLQLIRSVKPNCKISVLTSRRTQPVPAAGESLEDLYVDSWRKQYDQASPKAEISVIGGELSKESPIHDRWLVSGAAGLRFGTSLNSLGLTKDSEISEMSPEDSEQKAGEMLQYLKRDKIDHRGERLRLVSFWLT